VSGCSMMYAQLESDHAIALCSQVCISCSAQRGWRLSSFWHVRACWRGRSTLYVCIRYHLPRCRCLIMQAMPQWKDLIGKISPGCRYVQPRPIKQYHCSSRFTIGQVRGPQPSCRYGLIEIHNHTSSSHIN